MSHERRTAAVVEGSSQPETAATRLLDSGCQLTQYRPPCTLDSQHAGPRSAKSMSRSRSDACVLPAIASLNLTDHGNRRSCRPRRRRRTASAMIVASGSVTDRRLSANPREQSEVTGDERRLHRQPASSVRCASRCLIRSIHWGHVTSPGLTDQSQFTRSGSPQSGWPDADRDSAKWMRTTAAALRWRQDGQVTTAGFVVHCHAKGTGPPQIGRLLIGSLKWTVFTSIHFHHGFQGHHLLSASSVIVTIAAPTAKGTPARA